MPSNYTFNKNENLEIDLFIPALKTAIEIDGPAHFLPIWGQQSLERHIRADAQKAGLLINRGFVVLPRNLESYRLRRAAHAKEEKPYLHF